MYTKLCGIKPQISVHMFKKPFSPKNLVDQIWHDIQHTLSVSDRLHSSNTSSFTPLKESLSIKDLCTREL